MRGVMPILVACTCLPPIAHPQSIRHPSSAKMPASIENAQDMSEVVVPITSVRIRPGLNVVGGIGPKLSLEGDFGTGFCLDPACGFIATNYHVAFMVRPRKIGGQKIIQRYFATGPNDKGATLNYIPNVGVVAFAIARDLAIFELERSPRHHHGLAYTLDELEIGQEVDIYGYPKELISPIRKLTRFPAIFKAETTSGLLAFEYQAPTKRAIRIAGSSGGIVVDRKTQKIVAILNGTNESVALAVPVDTLVDFVTKVEPFLAPKIFPATKEASPVSKDVYPKFVPTHSDGLQRRPEEPREVIALRQKAQDLTDSIRNFIAVQSFAWGSGDKDPSQEAQYEIQVIDGRQRFRSYPEGEKELDEVRDPHLRAWVTPADEWAELPKMVAAELRLEVHQAPDAAFAGRPIKVFQYYARIEDNLCPFAPTNFFGHGKPIAVACYGEVWTDKDMSILRISERLDLSAKLKGYGGWENFYVIVTYGRLSLMNDASWLAPLTIYTEARNGKRTYWCRGHFTDYHMFSANAKLIPN